MAAYLLAGIDVARLSGGFGVYWDDGTDDGLATITGTLAHRDLSSVMGSGEYTDLASDVVAAIDAVATINDPPTLTFDATTLRYTFTLDLGGETLDFRRATVGSAAGNNLAAALGFTYANAGATGGSSSDPYDIILDTPSGADQFISDATPYYAMALAKAGPAEYSRPFEVSGQTRRQVSANGRAYSIGPRTYEQRVKFGLQFNTLASVFTSEASASVPWTYEALVQHVRCHEPVLLSYSDDDLVYKPIRGEFDEDSRKSVWGDFHGFWNLAVEGQYLGRL